MGELRSFHATLEMVAALLLLKSGHGAVNRNSAIFGIAVAQAPRKAPEKAEERAHGPA